MSRPAFSSSGSEDRTRKVASVVHRELSMILSAELADPRITSITITSIRMSRDLKHAKVFVTSCLSDPQLQSGIQALNRAASYIRRHLATRLNMKYTPSVSFVKDIAIERAERITELIDGVSKATDA